ncbi:HDL501Cp [Eremothecium sinecaudum]|uniref:HDL501Cp n=1 Tax=Eremothecium sinecaudum TaxID=45286 RepID=A0A0X8HRT7_9SACH|nr:HDL501Cp [Eremothecium sinecaudum]AMD20243.1 HDL501Cp [Eremothecium sinecaudum]
MFSQGSIPEVKEDQVDLALDQRRAKLTQFQDLGPPDLISISKYISSGSKSSAQKRGNAPGQDPAASEPAENMKGVIGTYLYCAGADTSDPTSIAVFLKGIADCISEEPQIWFGKQKAFKVNKISYATWNIFRQCDVIVTVHIPGTVQTYVFDVHGDVIQIEEAEQNLLWAETFISGVVRTLMMMKDNFDDGEVNSVVETRILNPLTSSEIGDLSSAFISLFPMVFSQGVRLGAPPHIRYVSNTNNYLVETLLEVTKLTRNFEPCKAMLEKLRTTNPEVVVILARLFIQENHELDAVKIIHEELSKNETTEYTSELICVETEFLLDRKKDYKLARDTAQAAVNAAPSEFWPWYLLVRTFTALGDIENALSTLNSCPIYPLKEKYVFRRIVSISQESGNLHLPLPVDVILEEVTGLNSQDVIAEHKSVDPTLVNLPAASLKTNFQLAYSLLAEIVKITGWESLLKYRVKLFVMEEEYQNASTPSIESESSQVLRSKRLCERWLDNLFMVLFTDLKIYAVWQAEQQHFEAQNAEFSKTTFEWELLGLCASRLHHDHEAAKAFQNGLSQRFSAQSCRKLLQYYLKEREYVKHKGGESGMTSSQIVNALNVQDNKIIDVCVKLCCWNHRWYSEFSMMLLEAISVIVEDMGLTKLQNEVASRYRSSVVTLFQKNVLNFFAKYSGTEYE